MKSWLRFLTDRGRTVHSGKKRRSGTQLLLEALEERCVPTTSHSYATAGSTYSQAFNSMPQNGTVAPNIAFSTAGPFDLDAQTNYTGLGLDGWQIGNAVG